MSKLSKIIKNNNSLKTQIKSALKQSGSISVKDNYSLIPSGQIKIDSDKLTTPIHSETQQKTTTLVDDSKVKGGYHVLNTIEERDTISCCYRKQGMKVVVVGPDFSFKEYVLKTSNCDENTWEEIRVNVDVDESEVSLIEDYSELGPDIQSQMELNTILKNLLLQLQQDIQEVEVPTKTSDLQNDGEDGVNPFITAQDIPEQVKSDWNSTAGPSQILNKPIKLSQFDNDTRFITIDEVPKVDVSTKAETDASNIDDHLHIWQQKIDANYVHDQAVPKSIWTINHPLNKKVSVTITDTAGTVVEGRVTINDGNQVVIEFNFPFSGEAILN